MLCTRPVVHVPCIAVWYCAAVYCNNITQEFGIITFVFNGAYARTSQIQLKRSVKFNYALTLCVDFGVHYRHVWSRIHHRL